jgi:heme exporter protein B
LFRRIYSNIKKDFIIEFRNRYAVGITLSFSVITTLAISLSYGGAAVPPRMLSVLLWLIMYFSAMNAASHVFIREEEENTSLVLRLFSSPDVILASKLIYNTAVLFALQLMITALYVFFMNVNIVSVPSFIAISAFGGLAISSSSTILSAMVARAGARGPLLTVISFPVTLPVLWVSINATARSLENTTFALESAAFLAAYSGIIITMSFALFGYIWIDE